jgi:hypothetical protein
MSVNIPVQVGADSNATLQAQIRQMAMEVFDPKTRLLSLNVPKVFTLPGSSKTDSIIREGFGTATLAKKIKGAERATSTTAKQAITITRDEAQYYTEEFDWFDVNLKAPWPVIGDAMRRAANKYRVTREARLHSMVARAACAASVSGIHAGGVKIVRSTGSSTNNGTLTGVSAMVLAYPKTAAGAEAFFDDVIAAQTQFSLREELLPQNSVMLVDPYMIEVMTKFLPTQSRDYGGTANLAAFNMGIVYGGYTFIGSNYIRKLWSANGTSGGHVDPESRYNFTKFTPIATATDSASEGIPVALMAHFDADRSPVFEARSMTPLLEMWDDKNADVIKAGIKIADGHDLGDVWCAGGVFARNGG